MVNARRKWLAAIAVVTGMGFSVVAWGRDLKITLPRRSELTPVQRLNREGVDAIRKHNYDKAEGLFMKAYLYDAADPFTLNNLGYISELEGKLDRAHKFYALASEQDCSAAIDLSNEKALHGKPMTYALKDLKNVPMSVDRMNFEAIQLLSQGRNFEADGILHQALALEPRNPFTINNLGVAAEATGDYRSALQYYDKVADSHSSERVVVTSDRSWRGKPVSEMAARSARRLRTRMRNTGTAQARAEMLTFRGVAAINRNDWSGAKQDFLRAYSADPANAFSLNNMGYVAEKSGDIETAQFYYSKARKADNAGARVGLATRLSAEGQPISAVAIDSRGKVDTELDLYRQAARRQTGPIELIPRGSNEAKPNAPPKKPNATPEKPSSAPPDRPGATPQSF